MSDRPPIPERGARTSARRPFTSEPAAPVDAATPTAEPTGPTRPDSGPPAPGAQPVQQPGSGLGLIVSIAVAAIVFVLAIYAAGRPTPNRIPLLQTTNTLFWIVSVIAILVAAFGAEYAERSAERHITVVGRARPPEALPTAWIVPAVATFAGIILVATFHNAVMMVVGPLTAFLGSAGALLARDLLDDASESSLRLATTIHTLVVHAVAFMALSAIYLNKMATPLSALLVGIVGGLLTLETLERADARPEQRLLYAALGGLAMAEATVALLWWPTHGWTGGAVLLVCFYLAAGVLLASTQRSVIRLRDIVEFGAVSLVALAILAITA
jgi:uncharacterized protein DUF5656